MPVAPVKPSSTKTTDSSSNFGRFLRFSAIFVVGIEVNSTTIDPAMRTEDAPMVTDSEV